MTPLSAILQVMYQRTISMTLSTVDIESKTEQTSYYYVPHLCGYQKSIRKKEKPVYPLQNCSFCFSKPNNVHACILIRLILHREQKIIYLPLGNYFRSFLFIHNALSFKLVSDDAQVNVMEVWLFCFRTGLPAVTS